MTRKKKPLVVSNDYIHRKITHMERLGIPAEIGMNGGACPSHLAEFQREERQRLNRNRALAFERANLSYDDYEDA